MSKQKVKAGQILLAEPFMVDGNFKYSMVLICDHSHTEGTVGFVLNKEIDIPLNDLLASFPEIDSPVFFGGPVGTDNIHYVHRLGEELEGSIKVCDGIWWGGDFEQLKQKVALDLVSPNDIRFFVGYSGWEPGQIQGEIRLGSWIISDMKAEYLFQFDPEALWQQGMEDKGDTFSILAEVPLDVVMN